MSENCNSVSMLHVLVVEPGRRPRLQSIPHTLQAMQALVGGPIQAVYPFEEPVALICNDEGKLLGLPLNRALRDETGQIYDIIAGTFFLCGAPENSDSFESLTTKDIELIKQKFWIPEVFFKAGEADHLSIEI